MTRPKLAWIAAAALLAFAPTGCLSGSTPYCEETVTILATPDSPIAADKSAAEVLALIEGEYLSELEWTEQNSDAVVVEFTPGGIGTTPLTLTLERGEGEIRWVDAELIIPEGPVNSIYVECLPRLEIEAKLGFGSEDGTFAELFDVVVLAQANNSGELHWAAVLEIFEPKSLMGMLEILSVEPEDPDDVEYHIDFGIPLDAEADLEPGVPRGYIDGFAVYEGHGPAPAGTVAVGVFELGHFGPV